MSSAVIANIISCITRPTDDPKKGLQLVNMALQELTKASKDKERQGKLKESQLCNTREKVREKKRKPKETCQKLNRSSGKVERISKLTE
jgi:hypothetical protein